MTKKRFKRDLTGNSWVLLTLTTRIFSAFYILFDPFWGSILYLVFDWTDSQFLLRMAKMNRTEYHEWDKILDWLGYIAMFVVAYTHGFMHTTLLVLFVIRLVGQIIFQATKNVMVFIVFPDLFSFIFYWMVIVQKYNIGLVYYSTDYWKWFLIIFAIKMTQEIYLHFIWNRFMTRRNLNYLPLNYWFKKR